MAAGRRYLNRCRLAGDMRTRLTLLKEILSPLDAGRVLGELYVEDIRHGLKRAPIP